MRKTRIVLFTVATILVFLLTGLSVQAKGYHKNPNRCMHEGCLQWKIDGSDYCLEHTCCIAACHNPCVVTTVMIGSIAMEKPLNGYCEAHQAYHQSLCQSAKSSAGGKHQTTKPKTQFDPYDVYDYDNPDDFADDMYEDFFALEDFYEDEDEAWDEAYDYWEECH